MGAQEELSLDRKQLAEDEDEIRNVQLVAHSMMTPSVSEALRASSEAAKKSFSSGSDLTLSGVLVVTNESTHPFPATRLELLQDNTILGYASVSQWHRIAYVTLLACF